MSQIRTPHDHDVLCGRGGRTNRHIGNHTYRQLVSLYKAQYMSCRKSDKVNISRGIVSAIRAQDPPGHFLEEDHETGLWNDIGNKRAIEKTSQALRESPAKIRKIDSISPQKRRGSDEYNSTPETSVPHTQTSFASAQHSGSSAASCSSGSRQQETMELFRQIELKQPDDINGQQINESVDQEITDLIRETFASNDNDQFDEAVTDIVENTSDNITADSNDTNSRNLQESHAEEVNCRLLPNTSISSIPGCTSSASTHDELCAFLSFNASFEKEGTAKNFNFIATAARKKVQEKGTNPQFSTNRAA